MIPQIQVQLRNFPSHSPLTLLENVLPMAPTDFRHFAVTNMALTQPLRRGSAFFRDPSFEGLTICEGRMKMGGHQPHTITTRSEFALLEHEDYAALGL